MNQQNFTLQPFASDNLVSGVQITGSIFRNEHQLAINYNLIGDLTEINIAAPANPPSRKDELWQDTCFEFFVGIAGSPRYWEFNLSPAGDWNVYRFDGYRQGMQRETAFTTLTFWVEQQADIVTLNLDVDLEKIILLDQVLDVAITTVVRQKNGHLTYWALAHKGAEADFHLRDSFIIRL